MLAKSYDDNSNQSRKVYLSKLIHFQSYLNVSNFICSVSFPFCNTNILCFIGTREKEIKSGLRQKFSEFLEQACLQHKN